VFENSRAELFLQQLV